eukprot:TRINITY_DN38284_c0_g1_i1.p1 TRINITY_DN38284_c0_g1~~TRINITY_DN38284_c0_g1_i1.p1  ORF type:complete len:732 (-),score=108.62 TRINITY_DN38284_c0_g1_i1:41-2236(-)
MSTSRSSSRKAGASGSADPPLPTEVIKAPGPPPKVVITPRWDSLSYGAPGLKLRLGRRAGRVGLENLGNTCFMSAGLQCLSHVESFAAYFLSGAYLNEVNRTAKKRSLSFSKGGAVEGPKRGELADAFAALQRGIWQGDRSCQDPRKIWRTLCSLAPHLCNRKGEQQDIQEFLIFCLDGLHEDLNRVAVAPAPSTEAEALADDLVAASHGEEFAAALAWMRYLERGKSFLVDLLQGQLRSSLKCTKCGHLSRRFEPFLYLSCPVAPGMTRLTDALARFLEEELLAGDEKWLCKGCENHVEARKKIDIWKLPPVLVIHLKRWRTTRGGSIEKIDELLSAPQELDLSAFCSSSQSAGATYRVVSVANHVGVYGSGHYTATCRVGNDWYHFDDDHVRPVEDGEEAVGPHAYVVFLVRKSTEGGCYTEGHHAPLLKRQTLKAPILWPHRLSNMNLYSKLLGRRREGSSGRRSMSLSSLLPRKSVSFQGGVPSVMRRAAQSAMRVGQQAVSRAITGAAAVMSSQKLRNRPGQLRLTDASSQKVALVEASSATATSKSSSSCSSSEKLLAVNSSSTSSGTGTSQGSYLKRFLRRAKRSPEAPETYVMTLPDGLERTGGTSSEENTPRRADARKTDLQGLFLSLEETPSVTSSPSVATASTATPSTATPSSSSMSSGSMRLRRAEDVTPCCGSGITSLFSAGKTQQEISPSSKSSRSRRSARSHQATLHENRDTWSRR